MASETDPSQLKIISTVAYVEPSSAIHVKRAGKRATIFNGRGEYLSEVIQGRQISSCTLLTVIRMVASIPCRGFDLWRRGRKIRIARGRH
jgi:hypothetical protein